MTDIDVGILAGTVAGITIDAPQTDTETGDPDPDFTLPDEVGEPEVDENELVPAPEFTPFDEQPLPAAPTVTIQVPGHAPVDASEWLRKSDDALFDTNAFIDVPVMDGQATDTLKIRFGGGVEYEATDEHGKRLFEALTLGKSVNLRVSGAVVAKQGAWKETANDGESVTGQVTVKIDSLQVLRPEDL